jgi:hypothetical protein
MQYAYILPEKKMKTELDVMKSYWEKDVEISEWSRQMMNDAKLKV